MTNELWWYVARSCGIVAWLVLGGSMLWGLAVAARLRRRRFTPAWLLDLHRHLGGLAVVFVALHIVGLMGDKYIHFGPAEVFVPLASRWRPGAVAWGVAGLYLLLAVEVTSLLRRSLPRRVWRATHLLSFPLFAASTVHLVQAGTDAGHTAVRLAVYSLSAALAGAAAWRVVHRPRRAVRPVSVDLSSTLDTVAAGHEVTAPWTRPEDRFGVRPQERTPAAR